MYNNIAIGNIEDTAKGIREANIKFVCEIAERHSVEDILKYMPEAKEYLVAGGLL